jgi:hypothetical protein
MGTDLAAAFSALKPVLASYADRLFVTVDTAKEYTLVTKSASPFPQHKGQPMFFGSVRLGKAYASFHLVRFICVRSLPETFRPLLRSECKAKLASTSGTTQTPSLWWS